MLHEMEVNLWDFPKLYYSVTEYYVGDQLINFQLAGFTTW